MNTQDKKPIPKIKCTTCHKMICKTGLEKHKNSRNCKPIVEEQTVEDKLRYVKELKEQYSQKMKLIESTISDLSELHERTELEKKISKNLSELSEITANITKPTQKRQGTKKQKTNQNVSKEDKIIKYDHYNKTKNDHKVNNIDEDFNNINPVFVETLTEIEKPFNINTKLPQSILKKGVNFNGTPSIINIKNNQFDSISDCDIYNNNPNNPLNLLKINNNSCNNETCTYDDLQFSNSNSDNMNFSNIKDLQIYGKKFFSDIKNGRYNKHNYKNKFMEFVQQCEKMRDTTKNNEIEKDLHAICLGIQKYCNVSEHEIKSICHF